MLAYFEERKRRKKKEHEAQLQTLKLLAHPPLPWLVPIRLKAEVQTLKAGTSSSSSMIGTHRWWKHLVAPKRGSSWESVNSITLLEAFELNTIETMKQEYNLPYRESHISKRLPKGSTWRETLRTTEHHSLSYWSQISVYSHINYLFNPKNWWP